MTKVDRDEDVRRQAYFLWEKAGRPAGSEHHFWAEAARQIEGEDMPDDADGKSDSARSVAR